MNTLMRGQKFETFVYDDYFKMLDASIRDRALSSTKTGKRKREEGEFALRFSANKKRRSPKDGRLKFESPEFCPTESDFLELRPEMMPKFTPPPSVPSFPVVPRGPQQLPVVEHKPQPIAKQQMFDFPVPVPLPPTKIEPSMQPAFQPMYHPMNVQMNPFQTYAPQFGFAADPSNYFSSFNSLQSFADAVVDAYRAREGLNYSDATEMRTIQTRNAILSRKLGYATRYVKIPEGPGRKPKIKVRWHLYCAHCSKVFCARPTPKNSRYVVNHTCPGDSKKRRQYVIGVKRRNCRYNHDDFCITRVTFD